MKFSYNWIRDLVPALDRTPVELMRLITSKTAECEGLEEIGAVLAGASVARVLSVEAIEGSDNRKAVVETARYGAKTVVCGAPNCRGQVLPDDPERCGTEWDRLIAEAFGAIDQVEQPLWELVQEKEEIRQVLAGELPLPSVLSRMDEDERECERVDP